jgi:hypothetical protein
LRRADPPSKVSYQLSNRFISSEVELLNRNRPLAYTLKEDDDDDDDDETISATTLRDISRS